jgi:hypothetical protein
MLTNLVNSKNITEFLYTLAILVLLIVISTFVLLFVWDRVLVPHITILKPLNSLFDALLMSIALVVIRG